MSTTTVDLAAERWTEYFDAILVTDATGTRTLIRLYEPARPAVELES